EPYKQRWRPDQLFNQRLVLGPGRLAPFAAARAVRVTVRRVLVQLLSTRLPRLKEALVARRRS
ncbi:hypothetical protein, partial [Saccharothrix sp. ST-888]